MNNEPLLDHDEENGAEPTPDAPSLLGRFDRVGNVLYYGAIVLFCFIALPLLLFREATYFFAGVPAVATVKAVHSQQKGYEEFNDEGGGGHPWYEHHVVYEFRDHHGTMQTGALVTTERRSRVPYERGQRLHIQYLGYSPQSNRLVPFWASEWHWGALVLVLMLGGIVLGLVLWLTQREGLQSWVNRWAAKSWLPGANRRRARLLREPFPHRWEKFLRRNVGLYPLLTPEEQLRLQDDLRILIAEKGWEGCNGLEITEEIQVTIAAQACILLLKMDHDYYGAVQTILVYPTSFRTTKQERGHGGVVQEQAPRLLGQAWQRGPVILAWDEVLAGGRDLEDGRNVVFHEFAHQLDFMGEPGQLQQHTPEQWRAWRAVMQAEFERLVQETAQGRATFLDKYGAQSEAEFFAVATEHFFEQPVQLQARHPQLYAVLREYYGQDNALRFHGQVALASADANQE
jgi:hypothetical protein